MSTWVKVPSPDHFVRSISTLEPSMYRHQAAKDGVVLYAGKSAFFHQSANARRTGVPLDRSGNVPVGIRIAMENPADRGSDDRQVRKINGPNQQIRGPVEIERQQLAAWFQDA